MVVEFKVGCFHVYSKPGNLGKATLVGVRKLLAIVYSIMIWHIFRGLLGSKSRTHLADWTLFPAIATIKVWLRTQVFIFNTIFKVCIISVEIVNEVSGLI